MICSIHKIKNRPGFVAVGCRVCVGKGAFGFGAFGRWKLAQVAFDARFHEQSILLARIGIM